VVQPASADQRFIRWTSWRNRFVCGALLLAVAFGSALQAHGRSVKPPAPSDSAQAVAADQLGIKIKSDRLTLALAMVPQVYLSGPIDAGAPQRVEALMRAGKIPAGSDIYLDSPGGDIGAGMALGRLFRSGAMVTHLGAVRRPLPAGSAPKTSQCLDACTYAYFGGLYRWAPSGSDRIGLHDANVPNLKAGEASGTAPATTPDLLGYLKAMNIEPKYLAQVVLPSVDGIVWLNAERMFPWQIANNGRLPLAASYQSMAGSPLLTLTQTVRGGENKVTLLCAPGGLTLTTYYTVGSERAQKLVARETRSYFEINHQEVMPQQSERARALGQAIVFGRPLTLDQTASLLAADSLGAWIRDKNGAVRYGFTIGPVAVKNVSQGFYADCAKLQAPAAQSPPSGAAEGK
jgi:hypothetical protein